MYNSTFSTSVVSHTVVKTSRCDLNVGLKLLLLNYYAGLVGEVIQIVLLAFTDGLDVTGTIDRRLCARGGVCPTGEYFLKYDSC